MVSIAIDGPSGAGKSSLAKALAKDMGYVYVDNVQLDESEYAGDWYGRITRLIRTEGSVNGSYTVPEGYIFVMGDNRNVSHDSRAEDVGAIPLEHVIGRACAVIWPIGKIRSTN